MKKVPIAAKPLEFTRANHEDLEKFDIKTKVCIMNCGPHRDDPRSLKERRFICDECDGT